MVAESIFLQISIIIAIAVAISFVLRLLKLPLIVAYILTGVIVSPYLLNLVGSAESIEAFAQMGIAVLLFMVGLTIDPKVIKEVGKVSLVVGLGQIVFTFGLGFLITLVLGFSTLSAAYIAIALTFSSTIIIMKLLSDKGDTQSLYGKISIGILIVQDLVAILLLMFISSFNGPAAFSSIVLQKVGTGLALLVGLALVTFFLLKPVTRVIAKSQELLLLFSIGWAFALASLFNHFGFSIEIGALLAGITLSVSPYKYEISSRMKPLRDFFLLIFFVLLGSQLTFGNLPSLVSPIIILSIFVLIGNPLIVMVLMGLLGYTKRSGFLSGLALSQISEFSFILIALAVSVGHVPLEVLSLVTIIGLITMASSSYSILHGTKIYAKLSPYLSVFERKSKKVDEGRYHQDKDYDIILFGYNRIGYDLVKSFKKMKKGFLVVDNNPEVILKLADSGIDCRYGDAQDVELLADLPMKSAKIIISTIPDLDTSMFLLSKIKKINRKAIFIAISHQIEEALELYEAGATYVLTPHFVGGQHTANLLDKHGFNKDNYKKEGTKHANDLLSRQKEGHKNVFHERD